MKLRIALPAAIGAGLLIGALAASGGGDDGYRVRAIFDNASFVIPGEDVRVAGVTVGSIADVDLTSANRAAVVLADRRSRLPALPPRRALPDPAAVADRRAVRRVRADAGA